ncbi:type IV toxin-antitoxin system AbiEi family antitoxin domain-containing protein [Serinicoccus kebangsaanensis]|uniref:type IV toxin-antitoxin system AbiEi family antitoxin domain-containing protein n=1 Tax=Serinicoccus kebangsaanensis TaxID=2602069 RepID=UPI00124F0594|nr:type IV toxin-antitoxin system AbiEi family antitoxin domain-containing protein [Serinicoccus kebangsaanensis]
MHPELAAFLTTHHHVVTSQEASALGFNREVLRRLVQRRVLTRVARGAYVQTSVLLGHHHLADRHLLRARALLRRHPDGWAASHTTAALLWRLPVLNDGLERVHLCHASAKGSTRRHESYTVHTFPGAEHVHADADPRRVDVATAVVGMGLVAPMRSCVVAADAALHRQLVTGAQLDAALVRHAHVPGVGVARSAIRSADASSESPGETLLRLILADLGLTAIPQYRIVHDGRVLARVDFYLPEIGVVLEFDGKVKYDGLDGAAALAAEKRREDQIRALGYGVGRVAWSDLEHSSAVDAIVRQAARGARPTLIASGRPA